MRGKHSGAAATRRARAESDEIARLSRDLKEAKSALAAATAASRSVEELRLAAALAAACQERDAARVESRRAYSALALLQADFEVVAGSYVRCIEIDEAIEATLEAFGALARRGYSVGNRAVRRSGKGSNVGFVKQRSGL